MATYYSQGSGTWSTTSNWNTNAGGGGSSPSSADESGMGGHTFIIQAGHSIQMDMDMSSWTNGVSLTTITSHATTPGMLYWKNGTSGTLKLQTGTTLAGTNAATLGRILANADGVWRGAFGTTVTGSASADTLTATSHGLTDGTLVAFYPTPGSGVLPEPLVMGDPYYVRDATTNTFKVAATSGGTAIDLTTDGSGTFGVNTILGYTTKAIIQLAGTAKIDGQYLQMALCCYEPATKYVEVYGSSYTCSDQTTGVNTTTGVITFSSAPPSSGTPVMLRSSGTMPTGLTTTNVYYTRSTSGNTCKLALQNDDALIVIPSATGSGTLTMYSGHTSTSTATVNVLQDVSSETGWTADAGHDAVVLADSNAPEYFDQQRLTLVTISSSTITLDANVDSVQYPLARIILSSRNVSIRSSHYISSNNILYLVHDSCIGAEIKNNYAWTGAGKTFYGYALNACYSNTVSLISGCNYGLYKSYSNIVSSFCGCDSALYESYSNTVSSISGCYYGVNSSYANTVSSVSGCISGLQYSYANTVSSISGCKDGVSFGSFNTVSSISGCNYGLNYASSNIVSSISGCVGVVIKSHDNIVLYASLNGSISRKSRKTILRNNPDIGSQPVLSETNTAYEQNRVQCENFNRVNGAHKIFDNFGDIIKTACDGTGDAPSVDPDGGNGYCVEASNIQSNCGLADASGSKQFSALRIIDGQRIWLTAAAHTVTYKVQTTYAGISAGNLKLTCQYIGTSGVLTETSSAPAISQRSSKTDWSQTISVTFTPSYEGWATFSIDLMEYEAGNEVYVWPTPAIT